MIIRLLAFAVGVMPLAVIQRSVANQFLPFKPTTINTICTVHSTKYARDVRRESCQIVTGPDLLLLTINAEESYTYRMHYKGTLTTESVGTVYAFKDLVTGSGWIWSPERKNISSLRKMPDGDSIQFIYSGCIVCDS